MCPSAYAVQCTTGSDIDYRESLPEKRRAVFAAPLIPARDYTPRAVQFEWVSRVEQYYRQISPVKDDLERAEKCGLLKNMKSPFFLGLFFRKPLYETEIDYFFYQPVYFTSRTVHPLSNEPPYGSDSPPLESGAEKWSCGSGEAFVEVM